MGVSRYVRDGFKVVRVCLYCKYLYYIKLKISYLVYFSFINFLFGYIRMYFFFFFFK